MTITDSDISYMDFRLDGTNYNLNGKAYLAYTFQLASDGKVTATLYALRKDGNISAAQAVYDTSPWSIGDNHLGYMGVTNPHSAITNVYVYDGALSQAQVAYAMQTSIPEPTTATLSLLALAGLAARRRK